MRSKYMLGLTLDGEKSELIKTLYVVGYPPPTRLPHFRLTQIESEVVNARLGPYLPDRLRRFCDRLAGDDGRVEPESRSILADLVVSYYCQNAALDPNAIEELRNDRTMRAHQLLTTRFAAVEMTRADGRPRKNGRRVMVPHAQLLATLDLVLSDDRLRIEAQGPLADRLRAETLSFQNQRRAGDTPLPLGDALVASLWTLEVLMLTATEGGMRDMMSGRPVGTGSSTYSEPIDTSTGRPFDEQAALRAMHDAAKPWEVGGSCNPIRTWPVPDMKKES